jgi:hypothetical protein
MPFFKAGVLIRAILGLAVVLCVPAVLVISLRSAYKGSPEPGGVAPSALEFPNPGAPTQPAQPPKTPAAPAPAPAPVAKPVAPQPKAATSGSVEMSSKEAAECGDTQDEIDQINARMNQPYTPAEGDFYRERLKKLGARLKELKCAR